LLLTGSITKQRDGEKELMKMRKSQFNLLTKIFFYIVLSGLSIGFLIPFLWMISTAIKKPEYVWVFPPQWIPNPVVWKNFPEALKIMNFSFHLRNTLIITSLTMLGTLLSSSLVAYGFAMFRFKFREVLFMLLLSTMMLPSQVTIIPLFIVFTSLRWVNTFKPLIIPSFFGSPFFIFLLRQFFLTIPRELNEAAIIDGAGYFTIYRKIILPLSKPAIASVAIFQFMGAWNDFFGPLVYLNQMEKYPLSLALYAFRGVYSTDWHYLMAASVVITLPCLIVFFLAQRYFIQGITLTGMKG